jgi:hypothetical protein
MRATYFPQAQMARIVFPLRLPATLLQRIQRAQEVVDELRMSNSPAHQHWDE